MSSRPLTLFQGPNFRRQWVKSRRSSPVESLVSRRRLYRNDFTDADKSVRPKWLLTVTLRNSAIPSRHGCFSLAAERVVHIQSARVRPSAASPWPEHANSPNQLTTTFVPYRWQIRRIIHNCQSSKTVGGRSKRTRKTDGKRRASLTNVSVTRTNTAANVLAAAAAAITPSNE